MTDAQAMLILLSGGFIGGFIAGVSDCTKHEVRLPFSGRIIEVGIIGDCLIGATTSLATYGVALASGLTQIEQITADGIQTNTHIPLKLSSIAVISGFAGIHLLSGISDRFVRQVKGVVKNEVQPLKEEVESLDRKEASKWISHRGEVLLKRELYEAAEKEFSEALKVDPDNDDARIDLAKVFRWSNQLERAIKILSELIDEKPNGKHVKRAIYNRACYEALLNQPREAISDLKHAIKIDPSYRLYAQTDKDFDAIRNDPEFPLALRAIPLSEPQRDGGAAAHPETT